MKELDTIREVLEFYAQGDWNGDPAKKALAALSSIDPEAIRREEHKRCIALVEKNRFAIPVILAQVAYNTAIDDCISILCAEPAREES